MEEPTLRERVEKVRLQRATLMQLLDKPDLGTLRQDVTQALEEIDDLLVEYDRTFPATS